MPELKASNNLEASTIFRGGMNKKALGQSGIGMDTLLGTMCERSASDLLITANSPPFFRINGEIVPVKGMPSLDEAAAKRIIYSALSEAQVKQFEATHELDLAFGHEGIRYRANVYAQRGTVSTAIRMLPVEMQSLEALGVSYALQKLIKKPKGLILVTGATGHGKTTTLASIIHQLNREMRKHIIPVEDPIEFVHENLQSLVEQREVGRDTDSFKNTLRNILRQNPDVIVIGEMRDRVTIEAALTMAETGQLTFATLHTNSAIEAVDRMIDVFPAAQQNQVRALLSMVLEGILTQRLLPAKGGGRVLACELLIPSVAMRNLIKQGQIMQLYSQMLLEREKGNQTLNESLYSLRRIRREVAMANSVRPDELAGMIRNAR